MLAYLQLSKRLGVGGEAQRVKGLAPRVQGIHVCWRLEAGKLGPTHQEGLSSSNSNDAAT
jgi:hypothetical protein